MTQRRLLPNRREHRVFDFRHEGIDYTAGAGFFRDGGLAELFLSTRKPGSAAGIAAQDATVVLSIALQHGAPLNVIRHALQRLPGGGAAGPVGKALDLIDAGAYA